MGGHSSRQFVKFAGLCCCFFFVTAATGELAEPNSRVTCEENCWKSFPKLSWLKTEHQLSDCMHFTNHKLCLTNCQQHYYLAKEEPNGSLFLIETQNWPSDRKQLYGTLLEHCEDLSNFEARDSLKCLERQYGKLQFHCKHYPNAALRQQRRRNYYEFCRYLFKIHPTCLVDYTRSYLSCSTRIELIFNRTTLRSHFASHLVQRYALFNRTELGRCDAIDYEGTPPPTEFGEATASAEPGDKLGAIYAGRREEKLDTVDWRWISKAVGLVLLLLVIGNILLVIVARLSVRLIHKVWVELIDF